MRGPKTSPITRSSVLALCPSPRRSSGRDHLTLSESPVHTILVECYEEMYRALEEFLDHVVQRPGATLHQQQSTTRGDESSLGHFP